MIPQFAPITFSSHDVDEAIEVGERVFYPHMVEPVDLRRGFAMDLTASRLGPITFGQVRYGSGVVVDCTETDDSYAMCIPLRGRVDVSTPISHVSSSPGKAAITGPDRTVRLKGWDVGWDPVVLLKFDKRALEIELGRMLGRDPVGRVRFAASMDVATGAGLRWRRFVDILTDELKTPQPLTLNPLISEHLSSTIMSGLLLAADHQYREAFESRASPAAPATIRRATVFIDENLHDPITTTAVAAAVGLSVRALERGFARYLSTSPRRYIERARLVRAHSELIIETPASATVAQIASRWGFAHHGRFANLYRATYDRSPAETLRGS